MAMAMAMAQRAGVGAALGHADHGHVRKSKLVKPQPGVPMGNATEVGWPGPFTVTRLHTAPTTVTYTVTANSHGGVRCT